MNNEIRQGMNDFSNPYMHAAFRKMLYSNMMQHYIPTTSEERERKNAWIITVKQYCPSLTQSLYSPCNVPVVKVLFDNSALNKLTDINSTT